MVNPIFHQNELKKGLYLVPTPIGNLGDITIRAIDILKKSDFILCEDTRVSKKLLDKFEIKTTLISNHKFNETKNLTKVLNILKDDKLVSLISDAGTPGISDPGAVLINECVKQNINIIPLPGPSAVTTAVSASGFDEKYLFYGFFPEKEKMIIEELEKFSNLNFCLVFFISPKKINKIIPYLNSYFKGRKILICREISKFYEDNYKDYWNKIGVEEGSIVTKINGKKLYSVDDVQNAMKTRGYNEPLQIEVINNEGEKTVYNF